MHINIHGSIIYNSQIWNWLKYPSADELIKMLHRHTHTHIHTQEYYSAIKKRRNLAICDNMGWSGGFFDKVK